MTNDKPEQSERNRLILELREIGMVSFVHQVADYIIVDRKRICEPLVELKKKWKENWPMNVHEDAIDETLKLALGE